MPVRMQATVSFPLMNSYLSLLGGPLALHLDRSSFWTNSLVSHSLLNLECGHPLLVADPAPESSQNDVCNSWQFVITYKPRLRLLR